MESSKPRPHSMIYSQQELVRQANSYPHPQHIPPSRQQPPQPHWDEQYNLLRHNKDVSKAVAKDSNKASSGSTNAVMTGSTPELANSIQQQVYVINIALKTIAESL